MVRVTGYCPRVPELQVQQLQSSGKVTMTKEPLQMCLGPNRHIGLFIINIHFSCRETEEVVKNSGMLEFWCEVPISLG